LKKWQKDPIILTGLKSAGKAELLGYKGDLKSTLQQGKLTITLPQLTVDELPCEHAWVIKVTNFAE
jgi:alpha-L-fucosidase